jgi:microcystin degradation protein MlrC
MRPRILSAQLSHETNTFSTVPTTVESFRQRVLVEGGAQVAARFAGTRTELSAHLDAAAEYGWDLVQPFAAHATPSGRATAETLDYFATRLTEAASGHVDAILLALHGAMACDTEDDVEGHLLERLRRLVGPDVPIAVTLDMHANVTPRMAANANVLIGYRTYPHVDQYEVAREAAALVERALRHGVLPQTFLFQLPMLDGCDHGRTHGVGPMPHLLQIAEDVRDRLPSIDVVSICVGFPWSDMAEAGPSLSVTTTEPLAVAQDAIRPLMAEMWRLRAASSIQLHPLDEIRQIVETHPDTGRPLVIADFSDNPGHGAPGDGIALIRTLLEANVTRAAVACIYDPEAVAACTAAGDGAEIELALGAKRYPELYGPPLSVKGVVVSLSDGSVVLDGPMRKGTRLSIGKAAVFQVAGISIVISSNNLQVQDQQFFLSQGIDPASCRVVVVKSQQHFRAAFEPIASRVVLADSGGFVSPNLKRLAYTRVRRPIWPLDEVEMPAWLEFGHG